MTEQELFSKALVFATDKHKNQTRKDGTPYIYHPLKVAELVKETGYEIKYQIVAVLHDTLEDTDATKEEIRAFGEDVLEAVWLLTRPEGMPEEEYVTAILENHMAAVVKNADKIHNMIELTTCPDSEWAKHYVEKVEKYYQGKFSHALDLAILDAQSGQEYTCVLAKYYFCTKEEMMLYSDKRMRTYNETKKWYLSNTAFPDFTHPSIEYWHEETQNAYFCFSEYGNFWMLTYAGWKRTEFNPFEIEKYKETLHKINREQVDALIEYAVGYEYFYDFVDVTKL